MIEIQAFVLSKDGEVIDVFSELEVALEEGARQYSLDASEDEDADDQVVPPRWAQESDDTWSLWGEEHEYTVTVR